jgi:hypothetical protein
MVSTVFRTFSPARAETPAGYLSPTHEASCRILHVAWHGLLHWLDTSFEGFLGESMRCRPHDELCILPPSLSRRFPRHRSGPRDIRVTGGLPVRQLRSVELPMEPWMALMVASSGMMYDIAMLTCPHISLLVARSYITHLLYLEYFEGFFLLLSVLLDIGFGSFNVV